MRRRWQNVTTSDASRAWCHGDTSARLIGATVVALLMAVTAPASRRDAWVTSAGRQLDGIAAEAAISRVDALGYAA